MNNKDKSEIVNILKNLVAINSAYPPGNSTKLNSYIFHYLKSAKLNVSLKGPHQNKLSLIAKNFKGNKKSIVFNSHIDTVQPNNKDWFTNPFKLVKKEIIYTVWVQLIAKGVPQYKFILPNN